jgi:hypothetical protein
MDEIVGRTGLRRGGEPDEQGGQCRGTWQAVAARRSGLLSPTRWLTCAAPALGPAPSHPIPRAAIPMHPLPADPPLQWAPHLLGFVLALKVFSGPPRGNRPAERAARLPRQLLMRSRCGGGARGRRRLCAEQRREVDGLRGVQAVCLGVRGRAASVEVGHRGHAGARGAHGGCGGFCCAAVSSGSSVAVERVRLQDVVLFRSSIVIILQEFSVDDLSGRACGVHDGAAAGFQLGAGEGFTIIGA